MKHASSILGILTLAIGSALVVLPASAVTYSVTDLGALPNGCALGGSANDAGQVIGMLTNGHAFVYTPGIGAVDIGTLRGDAMALAINNAGQVAGHANVNGVERAFLYTPGVGMADIGPCCAAAIRINEVGQVTGIYDGSAFVYTSGSGRVYLTVPNGNSFAFGINDLGQVVGDYGSSSTNYNFRAFFWDPISGMIDLGVLSGDSSHAYAVNNAGQVAGWSNGHVFCYTPGAGMIDLGGLSVPSSIRDINNAGQIVGATTVGDAWRGIVYAAGSGWTGLDPLPGFTSSTAYHISGSGYVIGFSSNASGEYHVVRWDPVPEPSSLLALCSGLVSAGALLRRRRRRRS